MADKTDTKKIVLYSSEPISRRIKLLREEADALEEILGVLYPDGIMDKPILSEEADSLLWRWAMVKPLLTGGNSDID